MSREDFEPLVQLRKARREFKRRYATPCQQCVELLPKAHPSMLLPGQKCRIHGWTNPAPRLEKGLFDKVALEFGLKKVDT